MRIRQTEEFPSLKSTASAEGFPDVINGHKTVTKLTLQIECHWFPLTSTTSIFKRRYAWLNTCPGFQPREVEVTGQVLSCATKPVRKLMRMMTMMSYTFQKQKYKKWSKLRYLNFIYNMSTHKCWTFLNNCLTASTINIFMLKCIEFVESNVFFLNIFLQKIRPTYTRLLLSAVF